MSALIDEIDRFVQTSGALVPCTDGLGNKSGEWVRYADHVSALERVASQSAEEIAELQSKLTGLQNAASELIRLEREVDARKGDPCTRLHNLCAALQDDLDSGDSPYTQESWDLQDAAYQEKCKELAALRAELAGAKRDAERYRLLRQYSVQSYLIAGGSMQSLDRQIDAALAQSAGEKHG